MIKETIRKNKNLIISILFGVCFAVGAMYYMGTDSMAVSRTIVLPFVMVGAYAVMKAFIGKEYKFRWLILLYSVLFSGALIIGGTVFEDNSIKGALVPVSNLLKSVAGVIGIGLAMYMVLIVLLEWGLKRETQEATAETAYIYRTAIIFGVLFLAWLLVYLAFYPGILSYDIRAQTVEAATHVFARANPPLHTFFWSLCLSIDKYTGLEAIVVYSIVQMLALDWACTDLVTTLYDKYKSKILLVVSVLFFASPAVAIMSFAPTKDVFFAVFFMLMYSECLKNDSKKKAILIVVYGVVSCLLRNNAVYAFFLTAIIVVVLSKKALPQKKNVLITIASIIVIYMLVDKAVFAILNVGPGWPKEKLSVMIQQITSVRVYEEDTLTDEQREMIERYLPAETVANYNPRIADPVKDAFNEENYVADSNGFWKVWIEVGLSHPDNYINAFLTLNLPYWYIDSPSVDPYSNRKFIETRVYGNEYYNFERNSILPGYYERLMKTADYFEAAQTPLVGLLLSIGLPIWLIMLAIAFAIERKRTEIVIYLLPAFFFWLTYMAGPVSNFRYIFPLYILYPFFISAILCDKMKKDA